MSDGEALERAQRTIASQEEELDRLRAELAGEQVAGDLREALTLAQVAGVLASPVRDDELLGIILGTAAHLVSARAGSLLLIDEARSEAVVKAAVGPAASEPVDRRMPLENSIAGLVATNGQPLILSEASNDPRLIAEVADAVGYSPDTLLCVPLVYADRVVAVLELVDKQGGAGFSNGDVETLALFTRQAAIAIQQSRTYRSVATAIGDVLESLTEGAGDESTLRDRGHELGARVQEDDVYRRAVALSELIHEIARHGDDELAAAHEILRSFAEYLRSRPLALEALGTGS
jgi:GAF domain-containing protein